jgi:hypothetical protein
MRRWWMCQQKLNINIEEIPPHGGECYTLIWGIMHFKQYLHKNHFILRTDHKSLKWLTTMSDAHGRRGRWIDMLCRTLVSRYCTDQDSNIQMLTP